jgi:hypothetical protein
VTSSAAAAAVAVLPPQRPGWWQTLLAVVAGSIIAGAGWLVVIFALSWVHLLPVTSRELPGAGWPWRIDGAWAFAADLGPMLGVGFAFAAATGMYLDARTGVRSRRWPLAIVAAAVGWFAGVRHGLVVVSGSAALVAVVIAAHHWSTAARRAAAAWPRPMAVAVALAVLGLGLASVSYSALHPLVGFDDGSAAVRLSHGRSGIVPVDLASGGPLDARVSAIGLGPGGGSTGLRLAAVEVDSGLTSAPTLAGLYRAVGVQTLTPGQHRQLFLTFAASCPPRPPSPDWVVSSLVMRLRVAGVERTVGVPLAPALRVRCGQPAPRGRH